MAKKKAKPKTTKSPSIETLAVDLANRLDAASYDADRLWLPVPKKSKQKTTKTVDPCAAEQATYDAAVSVMTQLFDATVIALQIVTIAQNELMQCRMNNP